MGWYKQSRVCCFGLMCAVRNHRIANDIEKREVSSTAQKQMGRLRKRSHVVFEQNL